LTAVGALTACGGGGASNNNQTAAQLYAQQIRVGQFTTYSKGSDPDQLDRGGVDVGTTILSLGGDRYRLYVLNTSDVGFINTLRWSVNGLAGLAGPTTAARLIKVTGSSSGTCVLADSSTISCTGLTIAPPKCTCLPGGKLTIDFVAQSTVKEPRGRILAIFQNSRTLLGDMTPVPYHIPSYQAPATNADLPICAAGQQSSRAHLCVHAN
jgi:hypothetical protein